MASKHEFEKVIEKIVGEDVETIRKDSIDERRKKIEKKTGAKMKFTSLFPTIGRAGNVLRHALLSRKEVEKRLDRALK